MSPFMIFAVVLTIVYVIYFSAMITYDLYGKKEAPKDSAESFDISSIVSEEEPISVEEKIEETVQDDGFQKEVAEDGVAIYSPKVEDEKTGGESEAKEQNLTSEQLNEVCNEGTEEIKTESSFTCNSVELMDHLNEIHKLNSRKIIKENVRDNL